MSIILGSIANSSSVTSLYPTGERDTTWPTFSFGDNLYGFYTAVVQPTGHVVVGGDFYGLGGANTSKFLARFTSTGSRDNSFNSGYSGPDSPIRSVRSLSNGQLLVGGDFMTYSSHSTMQFARISGQTGAVDTSFALSVSVAYPGYDSLEWVPGTGLYNAYGTSSDYLLTGTIVSGTTAYGLWRVNSSGSRQEYPQYSGSGFPEGFSVLRKSNGWVYLASESGVRSIPFGIDESSQWSSYARNLGYVNAIAFSPDEQYIYAGLLGGGIVRIFSTNGTQDTSFSGPTTGTVKTIMVLSNGKILVGGSFTWAGSGENIALLNTNGTVDTTFGSASNGGTDGTIYKFAKDPATQKIYAVGDFTQYGGTIVNNSPASFGGIVRLAVA